MMSQKTEGRETGGGQGMTGKSNLHAKCNGSAPTAKVIGGPLYSRWRDGADKVIQKPDGDFILTPRSGGPIQTFTSARQLLIAITGHPKARNWTFDRYFKTGRYADNLTLAHNMPSIPVFDLFDLAVASIPGGGQVKTSPALTVTPAESPARKPDTSLVTTPSPTVALGIDLVNRSHEVAKLFYAGYGQRVYAAGYDPEDVLQEVYKGLLSRNKGTCPWDPRKSSFGHYVHMVCGCIVANYHRRMTRRRAVEQIGAPGWDHGDLTSVDVASGASLLSDPSACQEADQAEGLEANALVEFLRSDSRIQQTRDGQIALRLLPYVEGGYTRAELADLAHVSTTLVSRALSLIRVVAADWRKKVSS